MTCQCQGYVALAVLCGLQRETARGQTVFQLDGDKPSVRFITDPPQVGEVCLLQFPSRHDLGRIRTIDVSGTKSKPDQGRACAKGCGFDAAVPSIKVLQLFEVRRTVVHILAPVGIGRSAVDRDTARCRRHDVLIRRLFRIRRIKIVQDHSGIDL